MNEDELREAIAEALRDKKLEVFSERENVDEVLQEYQIKGEHVVACMVLMNTLLEGMAKGIENGTIGKQV